MILCLFWILLVDFLFWWFIFKLLIWLLDELEGRLALIFIILEYGLLVVYEIESIRLCIWYFYCIYWMVLMVNWWFVMTYFISLLSDWIYMNSFIFYAAKLISVVNLLVAMWCFTVMIFSCFIIIEIKSILRTIYSYYSITV